MSYLVMIHLLKFVNIAFYELVFCKISRFETYKTCKISHFRKYFRIFAPRNIDSDDRQKDVRIHTH